MVRYVLCGPSRVFCSSDYQSPSGGHPVSSIKRLGHKEAPVILSAAFEGKQFYFRKKLFTAIDMSVALSVWMTLNVIELVVRKTTYVA